MKNIFYILSILLCFIITTVSCGTKQSPSENRKNNNSSNISIDKTKDSNNDPDQVQPIPEALLPARSTQQPIIPQPPVILQPPAASPPLPKPSTNPSFKATKAIPKKAAADKKLLGSSRSPLLNRDNDRVSNIKLAASKINGYKLQPGATFSFNDAVGKRDAANGFKEAAIIIKGHYGEDMGGGVCQLSGTLYNAVIKSKLKVIERHPHSKSVGYLPKGKDATVSYGYLDFKFKNNKSYPIEIKAWVENNKVYVAIYRSK